MHTAQTGFVQIAIQVVFLITALRALYRVSPRPGELVRRQPPTAIVLELLIGIPSVLQFVWPALLDALMRQPDLIEQGQLWRLLTSVLVQDSGITGTLFNLTTLLLALPVALAVWRPTGAVILFLAGALVFNLPATYLWHSPGAGSSAAGFFLIAATVGAAFIRGRAPSAGAAAVTVVAGIALLLIGDGHGVAVLGGVAIGGISAIARRRRRSSRVRRAARRGLRNTATAEPRIPAGAAGIRP